MAVAIRLKSNKVKTDETLRIRLWSYYYYYNYFFQLFTTNGFQVRTDDKRRIRLGDSVEDIPLDQWSSTGGSRPIYELRKL